MEIIMTARKLFRVTSSAPMTGMVALMVLLALSPLRNTYAQALLGEPTITVVPASAPVNVPRKIEVSGSAISCSGASIAATPDTSLLSQTGNLLVRVSGIALRSPSLPPLLCDILVFYRISFTYTPLTDGVIQIVPVFLPGVVVGGGRIITTSAGDVPRSALDITGAWYDPAANGSGFTFVHSANLSDRGFGTYYTYDAGGMPRWFVINNLQWSTDGLTVKGVLGSAQGLAQCAAGLTACPMPAQRNTAQGNDIQIAFEQGPVTTQFPPPPPNWLGKVTIRTPQGETVYTGTLTRIGL
jgi:hypothetical protein